MAVFLTTFCKSILYNLVITAWHAKNTPIPLNTKLQIPLKAIENHSKSNKVVKSHDFS